MGLGRGWKRKALCALLGLAMGAGGMQAQGLSKERLSRLTFDQRLSNRVDLALPFRDEAGRSVTLGECFGRKPVILVLGYYECPMLCSIVLNGLVESLTAIRPSVGDICDVVFVSISPAEGPSLAAAKKRTYLKRYGRPKTEAAWHFLTGDKAASQALADQVGFHYAYDPTARQYAHPSGIVVLTPDGAVAKYFFGVRYPSQELYAAVTDAADRQVGSPVKQLLILCSHFLPLVGKHSAAIMMAVRIAGVLVVLGLAGYIALSVARERRAPPSVPSASNETAQDS